MAWVAGVDAFKRGWRGVLCDTESGAWRTRDVARFIDALAFVERPAVICVDMPIGLPDYTRPGGRACEIEARRLLGPRRSSVFPAVGRKALSVGSRAEASALSLAGGGVGISAQAWGLAMKLREVDLALSVDRQTSVFEVHPELCFWAMNDGEPMAHSKKTGIGQNDRVAALCRNGVPHGFVDGVLARLSSGHDDFLDACAATWTARRILEGAAGRLPGSPERDSRGLDMAMWY